MILDVLLHPLFHLTRNTHPLTSKVEVYVFKLFSSENWPCPIVSAGQLNKGTFCNSLWQGVSKDTVWVVDIRSFVVIVGVPPHFY